MVGKSQNLPLGSFYSERKKLNHSSLEHPFRKTKHSKRKLNYCILPTLESSFQDYKEVNSLCDDVLGVLCFQTPLYPGLFSMDTA